MQFKDVHTPCNPVGLHVARPSFLIPIGIWLRHHPMEIFAHSLPGASRTRWELLSDHSRAVAECAAKFAAPFGLAQLAHLLGMLHDIGKASPAFQAYIRGDRASGGDHSSAGAWIARERYGTATGIIAAAAIAGHHAGLADGAALTARLDRAKDLVPADWERHVGPLPALKDLRPTADLRLDGGPKGFAASFVMRMLFSCLVDADFLATEAFYAAANGEAIARGNYTALSELRDRLAAFMTEKSAAAPDTPVNALRAAILRHALEKAALPPGLFTLTVPTGGGKTLASLSFALEHAVRHQHDRIIYVIPYTSIIEQTAQVFREALNTDEDVLEHHASFDWEAARGGKAPDDEAPDAVSKLQRAAENWDVPIVITTAVQFFESLFANRTSRCRKLHNIARSVVVLDEVQTLPTDLLLPSLAALNELQRNYGTSIVLCTATQPAVRRQDGFSGGLDIDDARELAPEPRNLYTKLKRVEVEWRAEPVADVEIAARFAEQPQMLCIVNTRHHARALFEAIRHLPGAFHLSTYMCVRHRRAVLDALRLRLKANEPVRLVATSLIEAGVDISFPEVWRAAAGVDSIAQAAGRCNREGELAGLGQVVVFEHTEIALFHSDLRIRREAAQSTLRRHTDVLGLDAVRDYFRELYWQNGPERLDAAKVAGYRGILHAIAESSSWGFPFAAIAEAFRMIDDEGNEPVIAPWRAHEGDDEIDTLLARIAAQDKPRRADLRRLQQYVVTIPKRVRDLWLGSGVLRPVHPALGEAMLRLTDCTHYRADTGVDVAQFTYRSPEQNVF